MKAWKLSSSSQPLIVKLASGSRAFIRPEPATDYNVFYEVFVKRVYEPPADIDRGSVSLILDLGANVGFSNLFWMELFPNARVLTYEPHPEHVDLALKNFELNNVGQRITMRPVAAGSRRAKASLTDRGAESTLVEDGGSGISIDTVDLFEEIGTQRIDLLKMDIEGGEYALLDDARFRNMSVSAVCMETHPSAQRNLDARQAIEFWLKYWSDSHFDISVQKGLVWAIKQ